MITMIPLPRMTMNASKKKLLKHIFKNTEITRGELVKSTGLSNLTVTKLVAEMLEQSLIIEDGVVSSTIGRRPNVLKINPEYRYIIGVDIGYHEFRIGVVRFNGEILEAQTLHNSKCVVPRTTVGFDDLCTLVNEYITKYGKEMFLGIGIGISGMVDSQNGKVVFCPNVAGYDNLYLADKLSERVDLPVYVDTTARCTALAEQYFGVGFNVQNQVFVSLGYGTIASGIILGGKLFRGANGYAGEIGHNMIPDGKHSLCTCGRIDCLENYASFSMLLGEFSKLIQTSSKPIPPYIKDPNSVTPEELRTAFNENNEHATAVFQKACLRIAGVISPMINTINPNLVILGGALPEIFPESISVIGNKVMQQTLFPAWHNLSIKPSALGNDGPIIGSSIQIVSKYLDF
ncbi:MAG: ROK family protein [Ruminococcaceae bacterium]|nr:ROK family protein [Oscillospiraceae bacterium]